MHNDGADSKACLSVVQIRFCTDVQVKQQGLAEVCLQYSQNKKRLLRMVRAIIKQELDEWLTLSFCSKSHGLLRRRRLLDSTIICAKDALSSLVCLAINLSRLMPSTVSAAMLGSG